MYPQVLLDFAEAIKSASGRAWLVGGSVRDEILGLKSKDFDVEVHGLDPDKVREIAGKFGEVGEIGKAFGVLNLVTDGVELDISLPRTDSKVGEGHRGFDVKVDPNMSPEEAARRRDFTINAMMKDPLSGDLIDSFGGQKDLEDRVLRVVDPDHFGEDPLRVLRGAQFVGRFGLKIDSASLEIMKEVVPRLKELPKDRIREEWNKLLMKSEKPSIGLQALEDLGVISKYHSPLEIGWKAILAHLDHVAAELGDEERHEEEGLDALWCAVSCQADDYGSFLSSVGVGPRRRKRITALCDVVNEVPRRGELTDGQIRQLAKRVYPANLKALSHLSRSHILHKKAKDLGVLHRRPDTVIRGQDLISLGLEAGPGFRKVIDVADDLRDEQGWARVKILEELKGVESGQEALGRLKACL